ncbi:MAG: hypothetical protein ACREA8_09220, partial [Nitrosotalea sp.]
MGQLVSRALTVMACQLKKQWKTMELARTKDFTGELNKCMSGTKWKQTLKEDGITFIKWDIKNQFTNLSKKKVIQALKHALNEIQKETKKSNFTLKRIKEEHHSDKIETGTPRTWTTIS